MSGEIELFDEWAEGANMRELIAAKDKRISELEAALKPFAGLADEMEKVAEAHSTDPDGVAVHVDYKDAVAARAALTK